MKGQEAYAQVAKDWDEMQGLLAVEDPKDVHLVTMGRLISRYDGHVFMEELLRILGFWGISKEEVQARCRRIWFSGYRPGVEIDSGIGSANDTEAQ